MTFGPALRKVGEDFFFFSPGNGSATFLWETVHHVGLDVSTDPNGGGQRSGDGKLRDGQQQLTFFRRVILFSAAMMAERPILTTLP